MPNFFASCSTASALDCKQLTYRVLAFNFRLSFCNLEILLIAVSTHTGRVEFQAFLSVYLLTLPLQILTTGSFLEQGSSALTILTAIHAGAVAALFWTLLANGLVATQVVEDGTLSSLVVSLHLSS
jgi:hypothetical protein